MAKRVFFSFHYQDITDFRANVVRNHWKMKPNRESAGFFDASIWEKAKKEGDIMLKRLINSGLQRTSSTCVLIGSHTYRRRWVRYEIMRSFKKGNLICGVHINSIKGRDKQTKPLGLNPFDYLGVEFSNNGLKVTLYELIDSEWKLYTQLDGSASYSCTSCTTANRGKFLQLSKFIRVYDWKQDKGYNNFAKWI